MILLAVADRKGRTVDDELERECLPEVADDVLLLLNALFVRVCEDERCAEAYCCCPR